MVCVSAVLCDCVLLSLFEKRVLSVLSVNYAIVMLSCCCACVCFVECVSALCL